MNREILFKGFHPCENGKGRVFVNGEWIKGEWIEGYYVCIGGKYHYILTGKIDITRGYPQFVHYLVIPETVGQYTGLTDKNSKKIFKGDITKHRSNYSDNDVIAVVTYSDGYFLAMTEDNAGFNLSDRLEVIGNIHDNPELLEVSE